MRFLGRSREVERKIERKTIYAHRSRATLGADSIFGNIFAKMYFDDCRNSVFPYYWSESKSYKVVVQPNRCGELLLQLFSSGRGQHDKVEDKFAKFVVEVAELLMLDGTAIFEICDVEGCDQLKSLELVLPEHLKFSSDSVTQNIPESEFQEKKITTLPIDRFFIIKSPSWVEGGLGFDLTLQNLIEESKRKLTIADHLQFKVGGKANYFDYNVFVENLSVRVLKNTKYSGWAARSMYDVNITEYYLVHRILKFYENALKLRNYILQEVSDQLVPKLKRLGVDIETLKIEGLTQPDVVLEIQQQIKRGDISFKDVLDKYDDLKKS